MREQNRTVQLRAVAEGVGLLAIVGSLVFVGLQMQQDQRLAEAQLYADASEWQASLSELAIENHEVWLKANSGAELTEAESFIFNQVAETVRMKHVGFVQRAERVDTSPVMFYRENHAQVIAANPAYEKFYRGFCENHNSEKWGTGRCETVLSLVGEIRAGRIQRWAHPSGL